MHSSLMHGSNIWHHQQIAIISSKSIELQGKVQCQSFSLNIFNKSHFKLTFLYTPIRPEQRCLRAYSLISKNLTKYLLLAIKSYTCWLLLHCALFDQRAMSNWHNFNHITYNRLQRIKETIKSKPYKKLLLPLFVGNMYRAYVFKVYIYFLQYFMWDEIYILNDMRYTWYQLILTFTRSSHYSWYI